MLVFAIATCPNSQGRPWSLKKTHLPIFVNLLVEIVMKLINFTVMTLLVLLN